MSLTQNFIKLFSNDKSKTSKKKTIFIMSDVLIHLFNLCSVKTIKWSKNYKN
jgi:predicted MPP superfamily phosphohydrolase